MIRWIAYSAAVVLAMLRATVPSLTPVDKLAVPAHLDDAVFVDGEQIIALSSEASNLTGGERHCFLSAWDIRQKKWLLTKPVDALPLSVSCGSLGYSSFLHRLLITAHSELLLVNPQTLEPERKISVKPNQIAAVGEHEGVLFALSEPGVKPVTVTSYDLARGTLIQTKELSDFDYNLGTLLRVAVISSEQFAVLQSDVKPLGVSKKNSTLAICTWRAGITCNTVPVPMPVANFLVSDDSLLFVSDGFADHSPKSLNECIARMSLATLQVDSQAYCRPDAGVHYSVATLGTDFVLGYSGYGAKRGWLDDGLVVSKSSSISIWEAKSGRLVAIVSLPHSKSFTLSASVIRTDTAGKKRFVFYNPTEGHEILLYDLSGLSMNEGGSPRD